MKIYAAILKNTGILALMCMWLFAGCETVTDIDLPAADPLIVVSGFFTPDSAFSISLSSSTDYKNIDDIRAIETARIELLENGAPAGMMTHIGHGIYSVQNKKPEVGVLYSINASAQGFATVNAEDKIPASVPVSLVSFDTNKTTEKINIYLMVHDPGGIKNYYELVIAGKNSHGISSIMKFDVNDPSFNTEEGKAAGFGAENIPFADFTDVIFDGKNYKFRISIDSYYKTEEITVYLISLSHNLFEFRRTYQKQKDMGDSPFSEPVRIHSNVINGAGIFAGFSVYKLKFTL